MTLEISPERAITTSKSIKRASKAWQENKQGFTQNLQDGRNILGPIHQCLFLILKKIPHVWSK